MNSPNVEERREPAAPALPALRLPRPAGVTPPPRPAPEDVPGLSPAPPVLTPPPVGSLKLPPAGVKLPRILPVVPVGWLRGQEAPNPHIAPAEFVRAVLAATEARPSADRKGEIAYAPDGTATCRFLTTIDPRICRVKLAVLWETNDALTVKATPEGIVMRRPAPTPPAPQGLFGSFGKKPPAESGCEVTVQLPEPGRASGEVVATGRVFGSPPPEFTPTARETIASLLDGARTVLCDLPERRAHPRFPATFPVTLFPIHADGRVESPATGRCVDVSAGGMCLSTPNPLPTHYAFVDFEGVRGTTGLSILLRVLRSTQADEGVLVAGRFKLELRSNKS